MYEGDETNFDATPPEENNNRTFLIVAGVLGAIVLLSIGCLAVYALVVLPRQQETARANANAQGTQSAAMAMALTATFESSIIPTTTMTQLPSPTPVLAQVEPSTTPLPPTENPATATVAVALTQVAGAAQNPVTPPAAGNMPKSGIADEYGIPGLVVATLILVLVIIVARRMRTSPVRNR